MLNDKDILKHNFIKRRVVVIRGAYIILSSILILKLLKLQLFDFFLYKKKSNNNSIREFFLLPNRGIIYDRNMVKIADTNATNRLIYHSNKYLKIEDIKNVLFILKRSQRTTNQILKVTKNKMLKNKNAIYVLARNLSPDEIVRLKFNQTYIRNMDIEQYFVRNYPFKTNTSTLIGYVMAVRGNVENKIAQTNSEYRIGIDGIEKIYEQSINGKVGLKYNIINAFGKKINEVIKTKPVDGQNLTTSIDQRLQNKLSQLLETQSGAATLLDVRTGAILAMVSKPNIDPNAISIGLSDEEWNKILDAKSGLLINKNISSVYPPGSTFKIVSTLAGLENGLDPKLKYNCTGKHTIGNRIFHCWKDKQGGHGLVDLNTAIAQSCNCYFYNLSQHLSDTDIYDVAIKLGLNKKHLPEFNELTGIVGNKKWAKKNGLAFTGGDKANLTIGQGFVSLTPIQLVVMIARVATNKKIEPRYLLKDESENFSDLNINEDYLQIIRRGLYSVINENYGTGYRYHNKKYKICGKTGTAQVVSQRLENREMSSGKISKNKHNHALFVGYAPYEDPRYAVSVVIEHGISGSVSAAPIGTSILSYALDLNDE